MLTWEAPNDSTVTGYQVLRKWLGDAAPAVHVADPVTLATSYMDTDNVEANSTYLYRVKAVNAVDIGTWSNEAQVLIGP